MKKQRKKRRRKHLNQLRNPKKSLPKKKRLQNQPKSQRKRNQNQPKSPKKSHQNLQKSHQERNRINIQKRTDTVSQKLLWRKKDTQQPKLKKKKRRTEDIVDLKFLMTMKIVIEGRKSQGEKRRRHIKDPTLQGKRKM